MFFVRKSLIVLCLLSYSLHGKNDNHIRIIIDIAPDKKTGHKIVSAQSNLKPNNKKPAPTHTSKKAPSLRFSYSIAESLQRNSIPKFSLFKEFQPFQLIEQQPFSYLVPLSFLCITTAPPLLHCIVNPGFCRKKKEPISFSKKNVVPIGTLLFFATNKKLKTIIKQIYNAKIQNILSVGKDASVIKKYFNDRAQSIIATHPIKNFLDKNSICQTADQKDFIERIGNAKAFDQFIMQEIQNADGCFHDELITEIYRVAEKCGISKYFVHHSLDSFFKNPITNDLLRAEDKAPTLLEMIMFLAVDEQMRRAVCYEWYMQKTGDYLSLNPKLHATIKNHFNSDTDGSSGRMHEEKPAFASDKKYTHCHQRLLEKQYHYLQRPLHQKAFNAYLNNALEEIKINHTGVYDYIFTSSELFHAIIPDHKPCIRTEKATINGRQNRSCSHLEKTFNQPYMQGINALLGNICRYINGQVMHIFYPQCCIDEFYAGYKDRAMDGIGSVALTALFSDTQRQHASAAIQKKLNLPASALMGVWWKKNSEQKDGIWQQNSKKCNGR